MTKYFLTLATALALFTSCKKDNDKDLGGIFKGPETKAFNGKAWTWIQLDKMGRPERVAISINEDALNSVPTGDENGGGDHQHDNNVVLQFHPKADATIFRHAWLNWNPLGHPPAGIYNKPHFDLHYYMVSVEERETFIDPVKLDAGPGLDYLPANHLGADPVPTMGKHFVDLASPELNGQPFTQTFIYGSYDSKLTFLEPMITLDFIKNNISFVRSIPLPAKFQKTGYYPSGLRMVKHNGVVDIILEDFVYRTKS